MENSNLFLVILSLDLVCCFASMLLVAVIDKRSHPLIYRGIYIIDMLISVCLSVDAVRACARILDGYYGDRIAIWMMGLPMIANIYVLWWIMLEHYKERKQ